MRGLLRWLTSNLGMILLSIVLSILVWAVAAEQENPTVERRFPVPVPIEISASPDGMIAYGETATELYVTLRTPDSVWRNIQLQDIHATVDIAELGEGVHRVPIQVEVDQRPVMVRRLEPDAITIHLEPRMESDKSVMVVTEGSATLGYEIQTSVVDPMTATISGPSSLVTQVVDVVAVVSVEGERESIEGEFILQPLGATGELVPHVTLSPESVYVQVPIERLAGFQDLVVTAILEGQVANGYSVSSITVDPPMVMVFGRQDVIDQIPGYLETQPLDLEGAQRDLEVQLPLIVPDGVSIVGLDEPVVAVWVTIVPQEGSITVQRRVELQGLSTLTATVAPGTVDVILSGALPVLEQLDEEDVRVFVDLGQLGPGSHSVEPGVVVLAPPGEQITSAVLPVSVQVEVSVLETPTPGPEKEQ